MDKLKMHSPNLTQDNIARIRDLFPGCVTEAKGEDGSIRLAVDFDQLRQELADSIVEGPQERYQLNWPGKREALLTANAPIAKTLRPCREESVDFDTTQNLFIEGDNLDALKLLQETYLGKVKMIYIDPPYNRGKDLVYRDDFSENVADYLVRSLQIAEDGSRLLANTDSNGRFHSDWLSMIYSRLRLARNLLTNDGAIFISCDENEIDNLKKIILEIFGKDNYIYTFIWHLPRGINAGFISKSHEYILVASKDKNFLNMFLSDHKEESIERCNKKIDDRHPASIITFPKGIRYTGENKEITGVIGGSERIEIIGRLSFKNGVLDEEVTLKAGWTMKNMIKEWLEGKEVYDLKGQRIKEFFFKDNGRIYSRKIKEYDSPKSILSNCQDYQSARIEMEELFGSQDYFDYPKPTELIRRLAKFIMKEHDLILDFFSGSATTAHAVMQLNAEDGGNRRFIMVQLPEACDEKSEAYKEGYKTIVEIGKERIRRAGKKILAGECHEGWNKDIGFRVLKIDTSNMADVYYTPDALDKNSLDLFKNNIKPNRTAEDLLFQVMLDWGVDLTLPIARETIQGKEVFFVDDNALAACFDQQGAIDETFVKALAKHQPLRVVFRDAGFKDDASKINVEQIFKLLSPATEVKCI